MQGIIVILICTLLVFAFFVFEGLKNVPRFHKGQKVKVKEPLTDTNNIHLIMYGGEILTIRDVVSVGRPHSYLVYENDFLWTEDMFENEIVKQKQT